MPTLHYGTTLSHQTCVVRKLKIGSLTKISHVSMMGHPLSPSRTQAKGVILMLHLFDRSVYLKSRSGSDLLTTFLSQPQFNLFVCSTCSTKGCQVGTIGRYLDGVWGGSWLDSPLKQNQSFQILDVRVANFVALLKLKEAQASGKGVDDRSAKIRKCNKLCKDINTKGEEWMAACQEVTEAICEAKASSW